MIIPKDALYFAGSYLFILIGGYALLNWLSAGVLSKFIRVKASRGRFILCIIHTKLRSYVTKGWLEGEDLVFYDNESKANKQKTPKRVNADRSCFYRFMGVWACNVDEAKNNLIKPDGSVKPGFDAIRWNNLFLRALMKPSAEEKNNLLMIGILILVFLTLILCIVCLVRIGAVNKAVGLLSQVKAATVTGVNV
jgi:hypothetical protein